MWATPIVVPNLTAKPAKYSNAKHMCQQCQYRPKYCLGSLLLEDSIVTQTLGKKLRDVQNCLKILTQFFGGTDHKILLNLFKLLLPKASPVIGLNFRMV